MGGPSQGPGYQFDLTDIRTKEVSLVDRPANKRRFLIVKKEGSTMSKDGKPEESTLEMGLEEVKGQEIPAPVLTAVIKATQSAIERLISLASKMEGMQKSEKAEKPLPADLAKEFRNVIGILEGILQKYPSSAQKSEADKKAVEGIEKVLADLNSKLAALSTSVEKMDKAEISAKTEGKPEDKAAAKAPEFNADEVMKKVKEVLDERATALAKMFQDVAKEEFGGLFGRVKKIEEALTGKPATTQAAAQTGAEYKRTFGQEEVESKVSGEENPFTSMLDAVKDY